MAVSRADQVEIRVHIRISNPVAGVRHSLQEDNSPLDPRTSEAGEDLLFAFPVRIGPGPKFYGKQVRPEGKLRRFVYIRIGQSAGDCHSAWSRRMKIDIHDIAEDLLARAKAGAVLEGRIDGTGKDGTPACATIRPVSWRII